MKVLLIEPAKAPLTIGGEDAFLFEPLALEYLAAGVARYHDVRILDLRLEKVLQEVLFHANASCSEPHINSTQK